jgi:hypothetical protein
MQEDDGSLKVETVLSRRHSGINDAPPQEPAVPQEALLQELALPVRDSVSSGTPRKRPPKKKPVDDISQEVSESAKCTCGLA